MTKFCGSVHSVLTYCSVNGELVLLELLKSKYASIIFYGLDVIFIDFKIREAISKAWNWVMRAVFKIKNRGSTRQVLCYSNLISASLEEIFIA